MLEEHRNSDVELSNINDIHHEDISVEMMNSQLLPSENNPTISSHEDTKIEEEEGSNMRGAAANMINSIVGAGIIGIPYAFHLTGLWMGIIMLCFVAVIIDSGVRMLIKLGLEVKQMTYEGLVHHYFGNGGLWFVSLLLGFLAFGAQCSYLIILGDIIPEVVGASTGIAINSSIWTSRYFFILTFALICILPLSLKRDLSDLSKFSFLSIVSDISLILCCIGVASTAASVSVWWENNTRYEGIKPSSSASNPYEFANVTLFQGVGIMSFAFVCHHSSFIVFTSLKKSKQTLKNWKIVSNLSVIVALVLCLVLALVGYLNFFDKVQANVLNNLPYNSTVANMARLLLAVTMVLTYPMEQFVTRRTLLTMIWSKDESNATDKQHYGISILVFSLSLIIALLTNDLGFVLSLTGALSGSMLAYVLPSVLYIKSRTMTLLWKNVTDSVGMHNKMHKLLVFLLPFIMLLFGFTSAILGTTGAISKLANNECVSIPALEAHEGGDSKYIYFTNCTGV